METLGNISLFEREKIAFFASSRTSSLSVLPVLDWATKVAKREDVTVCSGFQSLLEKTVLEYLLKGKCGILIALNRGIYKRIPEQYESAFSANRILFVSLQRDTVIMPSKQQALKRNSYLASLADELVFASITPESSLYKLGFTDKKCKFF